MKSVHARDYVPAHSRITMLLVVGLPFAGMIFALVLAWGRGFNWLHLGLLVGMYLLSGLGVTVGYHRLFTHRAFETVWPIKWVLGILGSMAVEGPLLKWVANHRMHHQHSDAQRDPHSPHAHGAGLLAMLRGFWHAHMGWLFAEDAPGLRRYIGDLLQDPHLRAISYLFPLWAVLGLLLPALVGGVLTGTWDGALMGFIWGGLARLFLVHQMTFSINSVCHIWGGRAFPTSDHSRNNLLFGMIGMGEGWHNNHHAFPTSARHGLRWWQFDLSYLVIRGLQVTRLAWKVRLPKSEMLGRSNRAGPSTSTVPQLAHPG